jgi:hypothetical protein
VNNFLTVFQLIYSGEDGAVFLKSALISTHELGSSIIFSGSVSILILKTVDFSFT